MSFVKKISKLFLATAVMIPLLTTQHAVSSAPQFSSDIFHFENPEEATGCHVTLHGTTTKGLSWTAWDVVEKDISYHQKAFSNSTVMAGFSTGQTRSPESVALRIKNQWIPRFAAGHPHGGLTIIENVMESPIGHVVAGGGDGPGVSEMAYTLMEESWDGRDTPQLWGQGIMSSVVKTVVTKWAPEVKRLGTHETVPEKIRKAFCCFEGESLKRLDATASPKNPGSWSILLNNGFKAAQNNLSHHETVADFDGKELDAEALESALLKLYDLSSSDTPLAKGRRYQIVGMDGKIFTTSHHTSYDCMKFHFENLLH